MAGHLWAEETVTHELRTASEPEVIPPYNVSLPSAADCGQRMDWWLTNVRSNTHCTCATLLQAKWDIESAAIHEDDKEHKKNARVIHRFLLVDRLQSFSYAVSLKHDLRF